MSIRESARRGAVLLVVVGIAAMVLALVVSFISVMRADAEANRNIVKETQARLMLHAAMMYVQEGSRLGWSDETREALARASIPRAPGWREDSPPGPSASAAPVALVIDRGGQTFGWTDIRNGWLGPLGPRDVTSAGIPSPSWWRSHQSALAWPDYRPFPREDRWTVPMHPSDEFPAPQFRRWPLPGSAVRVPMAVPVRPPYAVLPIAAGNPLVPMRSDSSTATELSPADPGWDADWGGGFGINDKWLMPNVATVGYRGTRGYIGMLDPQPMERTWSVFRSPATVAIPASLLAQQPELGLQTMPGTDGLAWFRIYRETTEDHDGDRSVAQYTKDGETAVAWLHDNVALADNLQLPVARPAGFTGFRNWNVFIITAGAGPGRGFRYWDLPSNDGRRALEPVTAKESGLFADQAMFEEVRSQDRMLWFRVEWTALQGGGMHGNTYQTAERTPQVDNLLRLNYSYAGSEGARMLSPASFGGSFKWVQRLDREPPKW
ncbi:MAG: hypothetical protein RLZZ127_252 [Planctomycetota bacterium]|jgi:type II secretory pathway pseudopilin PulG